MKHQIPHYMSPEPMPPLQSILDNYTLFIQSVFGYYREMNIKIPETCEISWKALQISHAWNNYHNPNIGIMNHIGAPHVI